MTGLEPGDEIFEQKRGVGRVTRDHYSALWVIYWNDSDLYSYRSPSGANEYLESGQWIRKEDNL